MGQKVHPYGFRLGYVKGWQSMWFAEKDYKAKLIEDLTIRRYIDKELKNAAIARVDIQRFSGQIKVNIHTAKPGIAIGKKGVGIDKIREDLAKMLKSTTLSLNILEVKRPDAEAKLIAENIAQQLEKRVAFRRAMKKVMQSAFRAGVKGIKVRTSGRLGVA